MPRLKTFFRCRDVLGIALGMLGIFFAEGRCIAQYPAHVRLTDPRTLKMATQTAQAGLFRLDSLTGLKALSGSLVQPETPYTVSVPPQCVGARRCPLLIAIGGASPRPLGDTRPPADSFGIILLSTPVPEWDSLVNYFEQGKRYSEFENFDLALTQVLTRFAIDTDKIAVMGRCITGNHAYLWGHYNSERFSRIVMNSTGGEVSVLDSLNKTTETLVISGISEDVASGASMAQQMRQGGHPTKQILGFRGHEHQPEDGYVVVRWLHDSWATPNPAARPAPQSVANPLPELTPEALTQMTAFWTSFQQEPDSIKKAARRAYLREVLVPVAPAGEAPSVWMVDMSALAARYPSVAADLERAGLTAQQHDAYRIALASAEYVRAAQTDGPDGARTTFPGEVLVDNGDGDPTGRRALVVIEALTKYAAANPVLEKNIAFMREHPDELGALEKTQMWSTP